jgi:GT2 family glycosyltransferase/LmbE family N-acetylglucosaminyl deacetylase
MDLLVLAPHPDDEILGCAGLMSRISTEKGTVKVVVVTDGGLGGDPQTRQQESDAGLAALGLAPAAHWGYPDGALPLDHTIQQQYRQLVRKVRPTHIALPSPFEAHPDHRRLTRGLLQALTGIWAGTLLFYETVTPLPQATHIETLDVSAKLRALECHHSQLSSFNYVQWVKGLSALRGTHIGEEAAEAHLAYEWDGSPQNFFEQRPLVSVIVRSNDQELLTHALSSIAEQDYDHVEVCVVWHGDAPPPQLPPTLAGEVIQGPGGRSANLNAGLQRVQGQYLAFLDHDDVWHTHHLSLLLTELQANPALDLVYGDYDHVICRREGSHIEVMKRLSAHTEDFKAGRLMLGNHIPIHAYVCRLSAAKRLRFDESLQAYEDWDFLLQAELDGWRFQRIPESVCEYRFYPASNQSTELHDLHQQKGYLNWLHAVRQKFFQQLKPEHLFTLLDFAQDVHDHTRDADHKVEDLERQLKSLDQQLHRLQPLEKQVHDWADLLTPQHIGTAPLSRLAGLAMHDGPCISLLLPVCDPEPTFLTEVINTIVQQSYPNWQLCLVDDASTSPEVLGLLADVATADPRIVLHTHAQRQGIVGATQSGLQYAKGSWVAFVDHDDRLHTDALLEIARCIKQQPQVQAIYTDSRLIDRNGTVLHTYEKPAWSPETLLHLNYINHLSVIRLDALNAAGGLRTGFDGSQDWDVWLRVSRLPHLQVAHIPHALYDWRASETSVAYSLSSKPYVIEAACKATSSHLHALGLSDVDSQLAQRGGGVRHTWRAPCLPLTAIVLTHRNPEDLSRLLASLRASTYPELHIKLVANRVADTDTDTHRLLREAATWPRTEVWHDDRAFNWAALNNEAARRSSTPWLLFLNDDVEWSAPDTLQQLTRYFALDPLIGVVGMRLMYGEDEGGGIQHDGIVTHNDPAHVANNIQTDYLTSGLYIPRNVSAVTGACLLTTKAVFDRCGGFDERFAISYNDVDYGLHVRQLGYRIVQASDVEGIHHESRTRGKADTPEKQAEILEGAKRLCTKWSGLLQEKHSLLYHRNFVASHIVHIAPHHPPSVLEN